MRGNRLRDGFWLRFISPCWGEKDFVGLDPGVDVRHAHTPATFFNAVSVVEKRPPNGRASASGKGGARSKSVRLHGRFFRLTAYIGAE